MSSRRINRLTLKGGMLCWAAADVVFGGLYICVIGPQESLGEGRFRNYQAKTLPNKIKVSVLDLVDGEFLDILSEMDIPWNIAGYHFATFTLTFETCGDATRFRMMIS